MREREREKEREWWTLMIASPLGLASLKCLTTSGETTLIMIFQ